MVLFSDNNLAVDAEHVQSGCSGVVERQQLFDLQQDALIQRTVVLRQQERAELIQTEAGRHLGLRPLEVPVALVPLALSALLLQPLRLQEAEAGLGETRATGPLLLSAEARRVTFGQHGDGDLREVNGEFITVIYGI